MYIWAFIGTRFCGTIPLAFLEFRHASDAGTGLAFFFSPSLPVRGSDWSPKGMLASIWAAWSHLRSTARAVSIAKPFGAVTRYCLYHHFPLSKEYTPEFVPYDSLGGRGLAD